MSFEASPSSCPSYTQLTLEPHKTKLEFQGSFPKLPLSLGIAK